MFLFRKLLELVSPAEHGRPVAVASLSRGNLNASELNEHYDALCETRPYVLAMREVAADTTRSW